MDPIERLSLPLVSYSSMVERPSISRKVVVLLVVQVLVAGCRKVVGTTHSGSSTSREVVGTTQWEYSEFLSPSMPVSFTV